MIKSRFYVIKSRFYVIKSRFYVIKSRFYYLQHFDNQQFVKLTNRTNTSNTHKLCFARGKSFQKVWITPAGKQKTNKRPGSP
jgi:hypothetical protein